MLRALIISLSILLTPACATVQQDRDKIHATLVHAERTLKDVQDILASEDEAAAKVGKVRHRLAKVIDLVEKWKDDPAAEDPSAQIRALLAQAEVEIRQIKDDKKRGRALAVLAVIRMSLRAHGVQGV